MINARVQMNMRDSNQIINVTLFRIMIHLVMNKWPMYFLYLFIDFL